MVSWEGGRRKGGINALGLNEGNEQPIPQKLRVHPDPRVTHGERDQSLDPALPHTSNRRDDAQLFQRKFDLSRLGELRSVAEQVEEDAAEEES